MASFSISPAVGGKSTWDLAVDGPLSLSTAGTWTIVPSANMVVSTKLWGAGGGAGTGGNGAGGGYSTGQVTLASGTSYQLIVGSGGGGTTAGRTAGAGGAGTGIQFTSNSVAIIVAGGGGGAAGGATRLGGGGGGSSGSNGDTAGAGGYGGTQSAAGAGGNGGRRTGNSGSGRNGGGGNTGSAATTGGTGFGNGGVGTYNSGDSGSGGGGGGYYGGGEGGGDAGGFGGGGGSGYLHATIVSAGAMINGSNDLNAGNYTDSAAGGAGQGGTYSSSLNGATGKIYFAAQWADGFANTSNVVSGQTINITYYDAANSANSTNVAYTITGVTSSDIMNTSLTGNFAFANGVYTLSIPTRPKLTSNNTLTITAGSYSANVGITAGLGGVRHMIVAGAGGGGSDMGGGGGAGGYISTNNVTLLTGTSYAITVGAGGAGAPPGVSQVRGTSGQNSSAFGYTAVGGGGGASEYSNNSSPAADGGSGGGVAGSGSTTFGLGTSGQGNNGGSSGGSYYPGGGGGAGAAGSNTPANGGIGVQNNILGTNYYWAAGGGGAGYSGNAGNGGLGGGGGGAPKVGGGGLAGTGGLNAGVDGEVGSLGSQTNKKGGAGAVNTGSGGGGGSHYNVTNDGGSGGSGIVVIRYPGGQKALGGTITTVGTDTVHAFYTSGVFQTFSPGLTASANTIYWGDSITFSYASDEADGTILGYSVTGLSSSQMNGASTTGNITMSGGLATLTIQTTLTSITANTFSVSIGAYTATATVTFLSSITASVGASWGANLTYTATTRGLSNNANVPYTITGSNITSAQLAGFNLSGTFSSIRTSLLGSTYFDGTGDYLSISNGPAFQFGTGDFTIECWIKTTDGSFDIINQYASGGTNWSWLVTGGSLYWQNSNAAASLYYIALGSLPANPTSGSWTHIAITRTSGVLKFWVNGTGASTTQADSNNYAGSAAEVRIGAGYYGDFAGNISNLRVVKGVAVYTGNFTPSPMPLFATQSSNTNISAITGTQTSLLTCKSQTTLTDYSTSAQFVTATGNVAANTEYPPTFVSDGNTLNIGSGTLIITTNSSAPLLSTANGFVNIGQSTNSFTIRNPNPVLYGNVKTNQTSINYVNTLTSDVHSQNVEGKTSNVASLYPQVRLSRNNTTQNTPVFINTLTSDVHSQNVEGKTLTLSNVSAKNVSTKITTTVQTIIPTGTFAYSSGVEISANGNAISVTPTVTQNWYI